MDPVVSATGYHDYIQAFDSAGNDTLYGGTGHNDVCNGNSNDTFANSCEYETHTAPD